MRIVTCSYFLNNRLRIRWRDEGKDEFGERDSISGGESGAAAACMEIAIVKSSYCIIAPESVLKYIPLHLRSKQ